MKKAHSYLAALFFLAATAQPILAQSDDPALIRTFKGHSEFVSSVAFSPDGRYALSGSLDHTLKLWDASTGRLIRTFEGHSEWVYSVAFSPDGRYALSGSLDHTLKLWDVATGILVRVFEGHKDQVRSVAFSPDGRYALSGSQDKTLKLWEVTTGRLIRTFKGHSKQVNSVAFSPDGRYALSGSNDNTLKLWEVATGRLIRTFKGHSDFVLSVAFSPDGRYALSGSNDNTLKLWDISTGSTIRTFVGHSAYVYSVTFSPDGRYALSGSGPARDNTLKLWDVSTGRSVRTFRGRSLSLGFISVALSPDGRYALSGSMSIDKTLELWDVSPWTKPADKPLAKADAPPRHQPAKKPTAKADKIPPVIQIHEPPIARGMKRITQSTKDVLVKGRATDDSGIYEVLVNGQEVSSLDAQGNFRAEVKLRVGDNRIAVKATDMHDNSASTVFTIVREAGEAPEPEVAVEEETEFRFGQYHALLIAVQDYADGSINDLDYPIDDAEKLGRVLEKHYTFVRGNIHLLKNPDRRDIIRKLGELRSLLTPSDNLLIFYAGHGYWDDNLQQGYWLPRDARQSDQAAWISNSDIRDQVRGLKARHTLLISDACFSGGIFRTREAFLRPDMAVQKVYELPSRKALTSGNLKTVPDRSVFVEYFVKRLEQNREPYLYSQQLYLLMRDAVTNNSPNNQTPLFGVVNGAGDEGGDFIFVRKR